MKSDKKKILILSHFTDGPETTNDRFQYLANELSNKYEVELITSSFFHTGKRQHRIENVNECKYKVKYIYEKGYKKNVCFSRIYSHFFFGKRVFKYLADLSVDEKPDLIYCAVPSLSMAKASMNYAKSRRIPFVIDIQDLWPEAFKMVFNPRIIGSLIYNPLEKVANEIYASADAIIAVSETYVRRAKNINKKAKMYLSVYLGTPFSKFDECKLKRYIKKDSEEYWVTYVGTLGHSYDLTSAIDAINILKERKQIKKDVKFIILGDGPLMNKFKEYSNKRKINAEFKGRLPYEEMVQWLCKSDLVLNPIASGAAQSIINKHADYAAAGIPVISTQECVEYRRLLEKYKSGYNCDNDTPESMSNAIFNLLMNDELRKSMGINGREMGEDLFNREKTYKQVYECIDVLISNVNTREE